VSDAKEVIASMPDHTLRALLGEDGEEARQQALGRPELERLDLVRGELARRAELQASGGRMAVMERIQEARARAGEIVPQPATMRDVQRWLGRMGYELEASRGRRRAYRKGSIRVTYDTGAPEEVVITRDGEWTVRLERAHLPLIALILAGAEAQPSSTLTGMSGSLHLPMRLPLRGA
jgi:hypothetical protein